MEDMKFVFVKEDSKDKLLGTVNDILDEFIKEDIPYRSFGKEHIENKYKKDNCFYMIFRQKNEEYKYDKQVYIYKDGLMKYIGKACIFLEDGTSLKIKEDSDFEQIVINNLMKYKINGLKMIIHGNNIFYRNLKRMLLLETFFAKGLCIGDRKSDLPKKCFDSNNYYIFGHKKIIGGFESVNHIKDRTIDDYIDSATLDSKASPRFYRIEKNPIQLDDKELSETQKFSDYIDGPKRVMYLHTDHCPENDSNRNSKFFENYNLEKIYKEVGNNLISVQDIKKEIEDEIIGADRARIFEKALIVEKENGANLDAYKYYDDPECSIENRDVLSKIISIVYDLIKNIKNNSILVISDEVILKSILNVGKKYDDSEESQTDKDEDSNKGNVPTKYISLTKSIIKNIFEYTPKNEKKRYFESVCICVGGTDD